MPESTNIVVLCYQFITYARRPQAHLYLTYRRDDRMSFLVPSIDKNIWLSTDDSES